MKTQFDYAEGGLAVAINHHEGVDVSITGNSTNLTRFQHPAAARAERSTLTIWAQQARLPTA